MPNGKKRSTILIADDNIINIQVLNLALNGEYKVLFASDGEGALDLAARALPDLILLDVNMPGINGFEVCLALKSNPVLCNIPVIFITSLTQEIDEAKGLELGAVDYITKPIVSALVKLRVRNHLDLKRQRDELSRLSSLDGLTGLNNRRTFDERLHHEWRRALRHGVTLSLIMIDIDYFKLYNDTFGHLAGDDCLREVARALKQSLHRAEDFTARYGGEEFVCLLPRIQGKELESMAEKLRRNVEKLRIPHPASQVTPYVTVSLGVASRIPTPTGSPEMLLATADRLLYLSKSLGRNRCSLPPLCAAGSPVTVTGDTPCSSSPLVKRELAATVADLRRHLSTNNVKARLIFARLQERLRELGTENEVHEIGCRLEQLDFTGALSCLDSFSDRVIAIGE